MADTATPYQRTRALIETWHFRAKRLVGRSGGREEKGDFEPLTPEQHAVISRAEPGQRGKTVSSLLDLADDHLFTVDAARKSEHPVGAIDAVKSI